MFDFSVFGGIQAVVNSDGLSSDSSQIVPSPGAVFRLPFLDNLEFSPAVNIYFTRNLYVNGMVLPASLENRMLFTTTFLFDFPVSYVFKTSFADYYIGGGLSVFARFALGESVLEESEKPLVKKANEFYWSEGRFWARIRGRRPPMSCAMASFGSRKAQSSSFQRRARAGLALSVERAAARDGVRATAGT